MGGVIASTSTTSETPLHVRIHLALRAATIEQRTNRRTCLRDTVHDCHFLFSHQCRSLFTSDTWGHAHNQGAIFAGSGCTEHGLTCPFLPTLYRQNSMDEIRQVSPPVRAHPISTQVGEEGEGVSVQRPHAVIEKSSTTLTWVPREGWFRRSPPVGERRPSSQVPKNVVPCGGEAGDKSHARCVRSISGLTTQK